MNTVERSQTFVTVFEDNVRYLKYLHWEGHLLVGSHSLEQPWKQGRPSNLQNIIAVTLARNETVNNLSIQ